MGEVAGGETREDMEDIDHDEEQKSRRAEDERRWQATSGGACFAGAEGGWHDYADDTADYALVLY